jgi:hypothetical protein
MPTAIPTSSQRTPSNDAPHTDVAARDEAAPKKPLTHAPELDAADDPYDNVACTD